MAADTRATLYILVIAVLVLIAFYFQSHVILYFLQVNILLDILILAIVAFIAYNYYLQPRQSKTSKETQKETTEKPAPSEDSSKAFVLLVVAVIGRLVLLNLPSVEPIIPLAVFAGMTISATSGFAVGALGYIISNLFLGGFWNIWTLFQALGGGISGVLPKFSTDKKPTASNLVMFTVAGTIIFEVAVTLGTGFQFGHLIDALPYSITHIVSNAIIALLLSFFLKKESKA